MSDASSFLPTLNVSAKRPRFAFVFAPAVACVCSGQGSPFLLLGFSLFLRSIRSHPFLAGASLLLMAIKPHLFLIFWALLLADCTLPAQVPHSCRWGVSARCRNCLFDVLRSPTSGSTTSPCSVDTSFSRDSFQRRPCCSGCSSMSGPSGSFLFPPLWRLSGDSGITPAGVTCGTGESTECC